MSNETTTDTEVQQTEAEIPGKQTEGEVQTTEETATSGVQSRINELTKKYRDQERANQTLMQQNQELMQTLTQTVANMSQQAHRPVEQLPEIDPDERKKLEYFLNPIQQQLAHVTAQLAVQSVSGEIQSAMRPGTPPEVIADAQKLLSDWRRKGVNGNAKDALIYAMGDYALKQGSDDAEVQEQRRSFNKGAAAVQTGQGGSVGKRGATKQLSEAEIERLSPDKQAAYFGSRMDPNEEF